MNKSTKEYMNIIVKSNPCVYLAEKWNQFSRERLVPQCPFKSLESSKLDCQRKQRYAQHAEISVD